MRARDLVQRAARPGEVARGQREPGQKRQPLLLASREHVLGGAVDDVVAVLDRHDLDDRLGPFELLAGDVAQSDVPDLALLLELGQGADRVLDRDAGVDGMELVKIDPLEPQAA